MIKVFIKFDELKGREARKDRVMTHNSTILACAARTLTLSDMLGIPGVLRQYHFIKLHSLNITNLKMHAVPSPHSTKPPT